MGLINVSAEYDREQESSMPSMSSIIFMQWSGKCLKIAWVKHPSEQTRQRLKNSAYYQSVLVTKKMLSVVKINWLTKTHKPMFAFFSMPTSTAHVFWELFKRSWVVCATFRIIRKSRVLSIIQRLCGSLKRVTSKRINHGKSRTNKSWIEESNPDDIEISSNPSVSQGRPLVFYLWVLMSEEKLQLTFVNIGNLFISWWFLRNGNRFA